MTFDSATDLHELIRRRAEEIYYQSGRIPGRDIENWTQAENEILSKGARRTAVVIKVNGVQCIGEYQPQFAAGYTPGEFAPGTPVSVRFQGDRMFIRRPNGLDLETTIVQRLGR